MAACWDSEGIYQEAINVFCRGLGAVKAENEKISLIEEVITMSKKLPGKFCIERHFHNAVYTPLGGRRFWPWVQRAPDENGRAHL